MNEIKVFESAEFGSVRTVEKDGEPWFVAADVCNYFGATNRNRVMQAVDDCDKGGTQMDTPGGKQEMTIVNESGLYTLLFALQPTKAREKRKALEGQIAEDKPFTGFGRAIAASTDAILIGEFAKLANNSGLKIGQNRLFRWLRESGYLMADNKPYQRYIDNGWFALLESTITTIKGNMVRTTTLITGKGQMALMERLKEAKIA